MRTEKITDCKNQESHGHLTVGELQQIRPSAKHPAIIRRLDRTEFKASNNATTTIGDPLFEFVPSTHTIIERGN